MYRLIRSEVDSYKVCELLHTFLHKPNWDPGELRYFIEGELLTRDNLGVDEVEWLEQILHLLLLLEEIPGNIGSEAYFLQKCREPELRQTEQIWLLYKMGPGFRSTHKATIHILRDWMQAGDGILSRLSRHFLSRLADTSITEQPPKESAFKANLDTQKLHRLLGDPPALPMELDEWLLGSTESRLASIMVANSSGAHQEFFASCAELIWKMEEHPFVRSNLAKNLPACLAATQRLNSRFLKQWARVFNHREARMRSNGVEGLPPVLLDLRFGNEYWPFLENALEDSHHRVRSTALAVAYQLRPLQTLQRVDQDLQNLCGRKNLQAMRWLLNSARGLDQDYRDELNRLEAIMQTLEEPHWPPFPSADST